MNVVDLLGASAVTKACAAVNESLLQGLIRVGGRFVLPPIKYQSPCSEQHPSPLLTFSKSPLDGWRSEVSVA